MKVGGGGGGQHFGLYFSCSLHLWGGGGGVWGHAPLDIFWYLCALRLASDINLRQKKMLNSALLWLIYCMKKLFLH